MSGNRSVGDPESDHAIPDSQEWLEIDHQLLLFHLKGQTFEFEYFINSSDPLIFLRLHWWHASNDRRWHCGGPLAPRPAARNLPASRTKSSPWTLFGPFLSAPSPAWHTVEEEWEEKSAKTQQWDGWGKTKKSRWQKCGSGRSRQHWPERWCPCSCIPRAELARKTWQSPLCRSRVRRWGRKCPRWRRRCWWWCRVWRRSWTEARSCSSSRNPKRSRWSGRCSPETTRNRITDRTAHDVYRNLCTPCNTRDGKKIHWRNVRYATLHWLIDWLVGFTVHYLRVGWIAEKFCHRIGWSNSGVVDYRNERKKKMKIEKFRRM